MRKKGVSGVVTAVLLILLVIGAVSVLWVVVGGFVSRGAENIELGANIIALDIKQASLNDGNLDVRIQRGGIKGNVTGAKIVLEDNTGKSVAFQINIPLLEFETKTFAILEGQISGAGLDPGNLVRVSVYPLISNNKGRIFEGTVEDVFEGIILLTCGDSVQDIGEQCDDGPEGSTLCTSDCAFTTCGDETIQNPNGVGDAETCDDGDNNGQPGYCNNQCDGVVPLCGNSVLESPETCDVGDEIPWDGCSSSCQIETELIAYYDFESNIDVTGNGHNVVCSGTQCPTQLTSGGVPGKGNYYDFVATESDRLEIEDHNNLDFTDAFTIAGWYYFEGDIGVNQLVGKGDFPGDVSYRILTLDYGYLEYNDAIFLQVFDDAQNPYQFEINGGLTGKQNDWIHITVTYDGTSGKIYLDGINTVETDSTESISSTHISTNNVKIGVLNDPNDPPDGPIYTDMRMDEIKLFNRVLTQTEVTSLFNN